jgi:hypothetical protein
MVRVMLRHDVAGSRAEHAGPAWTCSNSDRGYRLRPPSASDVDGDAIAEVTGALVARCGRERYEAPWLLEDGADLLTRPVCEGPGRVTASSAVVDGYLRARWPLVTQHNAEPPPTSPVVQAARAAYEAEPMTDWPVGLRWRDRRGEHLLVTRGDGRRLLARLYDRRAQGWTLVRQVRDDVGWDCQDGDNATRFHDEAYDLVDLDGDGALEVSFAYTMGCPSDASAVSARLLVLDGHRKHIVRGLSRWDGVACQLVADDDPLVRLLDRVDPKGWQHTPRFP